MANALFHLSRYTSLSLRADCSGLLYRWCCCCICSFWVMNGNVTGQQHKTRTDGLLLPSILIIVDFERRLNGELYNFGYSMSWKQKRKKERKKKNRRRYCQVNVDHIVSTIAIFITNYQVWHWYNYYTWHWHITWRLFWGNRLLLCVGVCVQLNLLFNISIIAISQL